MAVTKNKPLMIMLGLLVVLSAAISGNYLGEAISKGKLKKRREESTKVVLEKMRLLEVGNRLPDHVFHDLEMKEVHLDSIVTKPSVITIISPTCGACEFQIDEVASEIDPEIQASSIVFISTYHPAKIKALKDSLNLQATMVYDYGDIYRDSLLVTVFPFNIFVDSNMTITDIIAGPLSSEDYKTIVSQTVRQDE